MLLQGWILLPPSPNPTRSMEIIEINRQEAETWHHFCPFIFRLTDQFLVKGNLHPKLLQCNALWTYTRACLVFGILSQPCLILTIILSTHGVIWISFRTSTTQGITMASMYACGSPHLYHFDCRNLSQPNKAACAVHSRRVTWPNLDWTNRNSLQFTALLTDGKDVMPRRM